MEKVYIIVQANAYDGYHSPRDHFYLSEEQAKKECNELNLLHCGGNKKLLDFDVRSIDKDFVRVGCHNVSMKEIKNMANQLNW